MISALVSFDLFEFHPLRLAVKFIYTGDAGKWRLFLMMQYNPGDFHGI